MTGTVDEGFIARTYKTSAYLWVFGVLVCWAISGIYAIAGWTLGAAMSVGILLSLEIIVRRAFVPGAVKPKLELLKLGLVKIVAVLLVLAFVVWVGKHSYSFVAGFCVGIALTQVVMFLKVLGMLVSQRLNG